nr:MULTISPECIES: putative holin [Serratia]ULG12092.1 hypothetical protein D1p1_00060 [Serratia entomophila]ULG16019.1 hypothetical protein 591p_00169 [Serratia proteamaculans]ULG18335.1 hypothetical protein Man4p_00016 [Serratia proteamaculans]ULG18430.1 hypothetical protein Man4p_00113 [Serratia proteamaculans]ULG19131.1 hypothetical protein Sm1ap2_00017 [Serratia proteamaculans]
MLIGIFDGLYAPRVIAAFSGAMVFIITQDNFIGIRRVLLFFVSFLLGLTFSETTASVINFYIPNDIHIGNDLGAFVTSAVTVKLFVIIMSKIERKYLGE